MKSTFFQEYLVKLGVLSLMLACVLSAFGNPLIAILISFILPIILCHIILNKLWKNEGEILGLPYYEIMPGWKKWLLSIVTTTICSQVGWLALLV